MTKLLLLSVALVGCAPPAYYVANVFADDHGSLFTVCRLIRSMAAVMATSQIPRTAATNVSGPAAGRAQAQIYGAIPLWPPPAPAA